MSRGDRTKNVAFTGALVYYCSELRDAFAEHLDEYDGEVLPNLFMSDVRRWAEQHAHESGVDHPSLRRILAFLEEGFASGSTSLHDLIGASFLEELADPGEPGAELRYALGKTMTEHVERYEL